MAECKLSVVVPVYKVEQYLDRCVESILNQTFSDFELILVDDGSPDNCPRMCDEWAEKDSRIKVIHQENRGLVGAVRHGVEFAVSEYITFADSDDWVEPTYLQTLHNGIVENQADVVQCNYRTVDENLDNCEYIYPFRIFEGTEAIKRELLVPMADTATPDWIPHMDNNRWSKIYKADVLKEAMPYYDPAVAIAEDFLMNFAVFGMCNKIVVLDTPPLYNYSYNPSSIMTDYSRKKMLNMDPFCRDMENLAELYGCQTGDVGFRKNWYYTKYLYGRVASNQSRKIRKEEIKAILAELDRKKWFKSIKTMEKRLDRIGMYLYYFGLLDVALTLVDMSKMLRKWRSQ